MKKLTAFIYSVVLLALAAYLWYGKKADISNIDVKGAVADESGVIQAHVEDRYEALDKKLDMLDAKLDKILDALNPKLPDNLQTVE